MKHQIGELACFLEYWQLLASNKSYLKSERSQYPFMTDSNFEQRASTMWSSTWGSSLNAFLSSIISLSVPFDDDDDSFWKDDIFYSSLKLFFTYCDILWVSHTVFHKSNNHREQNKIRIPVTGQLLPEKNSWSFIAKRHGNNSTKYWMEYGMIIFHHDGEIVFF